MNPFAVLVSNQTTGAGTVFTTEIAAKKIIIFTANGTNADAAQQAPYRWQRVLDNDASAVNGAQFVGQMLVGETAKWAGDPRSGRRHRVFGAIYPERNLNFDLFLEGFAEVQGHKLAEKVQYLGAAGCRARRCRRTRPEAPTLLMAKLKATGVTSVIAVRVAQMAGQAMKAATTSTSTPSGSSPGLGVPRPREHRAAPTYQTQMAHAFGVGTLLMNVTDTTPSTSTSSGIGARTRRTYQPGALSYCQTFLHRRHARAARS